MRYTTDPNYKDLSLTVRSFLHSDEELLWTGRPYATQPYRSSGFLLLFSFFWLGFSIFWTVGATAAGGAFGLFGVPFMIIGCYLVYSVTVGQRKTLSETVYAVTNRRALIIIRGKKGLNCCEYVLSNLTGISLEDVKENSGTIRLAPHQVYYDHRGNRRNTAPDDLTTAFLMIDNVHSVYNLISEQLGRD